MPIPGNEVSMATTPKTADAPVSNTPEQVIIQSVYGRMIHPETLKEFDTNSLTKAPKDWWVNIQLEAGKLKIAE